MSPVPKRATERNEQKYKENDQSIKAALDRLRQDRRLKPTQASLARLAKCSRGTINNRQWALTELKEIKAGRRQASRGKQRAANQTIPTEADMKSQLAAARDETARWKALYDEIRDKLNHISKINEQLRSRQAPVDSRRKNKPKLHTVTPLKAKPS